MFMTANQFGLEAKDVTREVDWRPIMKMILNEADTAKDDFEKMMIEVRDRLMETVNIASRITPLVQIYDEPYFPRPKGHMRRIAISLYDRYNTTIEFCLARRNVLKSLKDIALDAVTKNVKNGLQINNMEVPETLKMTLRKEFYKAWAKKRFPSYSIYMLPNNEAKKRKSSIANVQLKESKKAKRPNISLHRIPRD